MEFSDEMKNTLLSKIGDIDENGCMLYMGHIEVDGYGRFLYKPHRLQAHRLALAISTGGLYYREEIACHDPILCKSRACCNPQHLRWATQLDNVHDQIIIGTRPRGSIVKQSVLREEDIPIIRSMFNTHNNKQIADKYGVDPSTIRFIKIGHTWKHVT
jgi:hypothetical protein